MDGDRSLIDVVFDRLADEGVEDAVANLVLGACTGPSALDDVLAGRPADLPVPDEAPAERPDPLYLESIKVAGFRGVGPTATLGLQPHAGLTLVIGRNGSGKSSLAEAVELALTGDNERWAAGSSVFSEGWRNLHSGAPCEIDVRLRPDGGSPPVRIRRSWRDDATRPGDASVAVTAGDRRYANTAELGWGAPLEAYRPFLSAKDLGTLVSARPSDLHDALRPILGLGVLTEAERMLMAAKSALTARANAAKDERNRLRQLLGASPDPTAQRAASLLGKRKVDLAAVAELVDQAEDDDPLAALCRDLAAMPLTDIDTALGIADELEADADGFAAAAASGAGTSDRLAQLLRLALEYHDAHGDDQCPVCGEGTLDAAWRNRSDTALDRFRSDTAALNRARARLVEAEGRAANLLATRLPTPPLAMPVPAGPLAEALGRLAAALRTWQGVPPSAAGPRATANHIRSAYPALADAALAARTAAQEHLRHRHDEWRQHAPALRDWLARAIVVEQEAPVLTKLKTARDWLLGVTDQLQAERLAPFAAHAQRIWERLRQESNVELAGMKLEGARTRRRVAFPVNVDGTATSALSVMSQGELQSLGLAVFLPRACADESPFRFVVIDDPVQSMDPSKVDGLARVLGELAEHRQVVVFTHDDRLPEAVRRLRIDATIWEVARRAASVVEVRKNADPVQRYLDDARAVAKSDDLAADMRSPVVAGFCRSAIEAACHERIRRDRLKAGERHAEVEDLIEGAQTVTAVAALALFGRTDAGGQVLPYLDRRGAWAADVFRACKEGVHRTGSADLPWLVDGVTRLVRDVVLG